MRINIALERIGDYAVTICREAVQLPKVPEGILARELELMSKEARQMLHQAMEAFADQNAEAAKATMTMADQMDQAFDTVVDELTGTNGEWTKHDIFALLVIFHELERVSDQAKNICEETVFAATGEGKAPKVYRVLFLDQDNAGISKLAESLGRKSYANYVVFASAGRAASTSKPSSADLPWAPKFDAARSIIASGPSFETAVSRSVSTSASSAKEGGTNSGNPASSCWRSIS
jgi:hypothetical protein